MNGTILIAEDDRYLRTLFAKAFKASNFAVFTASDGSETLHHLQNIVPDVITLDINMPDVSGLQILQHVRSSQAYKKTAIIVVTGDYQAQYAPEAALTDLFLFKPVTMSELTRLAKSLIRTRNEPNTNQ